MGFSASILPNFVGFTWFNSLLMWLISRFAPINMFTNTAILGFSPFAFPPNGKLKPSPLNPGDSNSDGELLLLPKV